MTTVSDLSGGMVFEKKYFLLNLPKVESSVINNWVTITFSTLQKSHKHPYFSSYISNKLSNYLSNMANNMRHMWLQIALVCFYYYYFVAFIENVLAKLYPNIDSISNAAICVWIIAYFKIMLKIKCHPLVQYESKYISWKKID